MYIFGLPRNKSGKESRLILNKGPFSVTLPLSGCLMRWSTFMAFLKSMHSSWKTFGPLVWVIDFIRKYSSPPIVRFSALIQKVSLCFEQSFCSSLSSLQAATSRNFCLVCLVPIFSSTVILMEVSPKRCQLKSEFWMVFGLKSSSLGDVKFLWGQVSKGTMWMIFIVIAPLFNLLLGIQKG